LKIHDSIKPGILSAIYSCRRVIVASVSSGMSGLGIFGLLLIAPATVSATGYHIGPGQTYTTIGAAPWSSLVPGDTMYIHAKANQLPYFEHIYVSAALQGTQQNPIKIIGVSDGSGNQPILDGTNSITGTHFNTYGSSMYHSQLGLVVFGPSATGGAYSAPHWVELSNIRIQNYVNVSTTDEAGATEAGVSGACVYLQGGQNVTLDGITITGCADGIFAKDGGVSPVRYITIKKSRIYGNGVVDDYLYHNLYTEVKYLTCEYNYFGPPVSGSPGNNIKDRSVGLVFRYNWVDGGAHLMDIVECQDNCADHTADPAWNDSFVYGNIFYSGPGAASQVFHFGSGDNGADTSVWRKNLYFYNNTVHLKQDQSESYYVNLFQISGPEQTVSLDNNIFFVEDAGSGSAPEVYLQYDGSTTASAYGNMIFGSNWISPGWQTTNPSTSVTGTITGLSNIISPVGNSPFFADIAAQDYHLTPSSGARGKGRSLPSIVSTGNALAKDFTPVAQYVKHQTFEQRTGVSDLGALEFGFSDTIPPTVTAFTIPATSSSLVVAVSVFTATDDTAVSAYMITENATKPLTSNAGWSATAPTVYTFGGSGVRIAYAWAKDAAGNISNSLTDTVTITQLDSTAPIISTFTMPSTAASMTVAVNEFSATDNVAVTGYMITESSSAPLAGAEGWSATPNSNFNFSTAGSRTAYAWAKDAAGNVSISLSQSVSIAIPLTQPTISDALKVLRAVAGIFPLTDLEQIRYDVAPLGSNGLPFGNGIIDVADVILILRRSIGIGSW